MITLQAQPGCCEEASPLSQEQYVPCNRTASYLIQTADPSPYRMCAACADHNLRRRGAFILEVLGKK